MSVYKKTISITGSWVKTNELENGSKATIVSETNPQPSQWLNKDGTAKTQDICKVNFEKMSEVVNVSLNRATINGLVDAFGENSTNWQNKPLTVETEKMRVGGKAVIALYLVPENYQKVDDNNGYATIVKIGLGSAPNVKNSDIPIVEEGEEIPSEPGPEYEE